MNSEEGNQPDELAFNSETGRNEEDEFPLIEEFQFMSNN
jgi:hypothetical protein